MKKRILSFVLLMLMVITSFASAADLGYVMNEGDISFTSVTFANDGTNVSASLNGIKAQGADSVTLMLTVYNSKHKMVDASSDTKSVGTEAVELKATAPVPAGEFTLDATLFNSANGLSPIAAPAYSDYDGATELLDLKVEGKTLEGFKSDVYDYKYITEGATTYPEITATVREGSTKVTASYEDKFPGVATITVANAKGTTSVYKIDFTPLRHIVVGATSDSDFDVDIGTNLNLVSSAAVSEGVGGKKIYTNLSGADDDSLDFGSRWTSDYQPLSSHHAIRYVDPMLQGWDYFVCPNGTMKADQGDYFDFEVNHNARIVVVTLEKEPALVANGFEALTSKKYLMASFAAGGAKEDVRADLNGLGITPTYADMYFYNKNAADHSALVKYFVEKYNLDEKLATEDIPINKKINIPEHTYQYAYSKFYEAYEDEPARVIIPAPQATQGRGYIVAVIPVGEDGELPGGGNEGGDTPDTPVVPEEPEGDLGELVSLVDGKTYSQYIDYVNSVVPADKAMTKEATVTETTKISTNYNRISTIAEDGAVCSISSWRVFKNVAEDWKGLSFMTSDPSFYQEGSAKGWPVAVFSGKKASYDGDVCEAADNQIVPWWNIKVNKDMNVSIVTDKELNHLTKEEYGAWTKLTIGTDIENPFKIYDNRNGSAINGSNKYVYTKSYKAGDTVVLYNENSKNIGYVPYVAVFGTPDVEGGDEPDEPDTPVVPDEPILAEGNHIIVGARYVDEIVADADVTDGFKSAKAVTSAKSSKTDGVVYTNLRGTPDEAGTTYGARLTLMPANNASYHEVYYADETIAGNDYFVFTAGGNAHSDNPLLKFDIVADAEVYILATSNALTFEGFTLEENANGWVKGRFINRNMADAMNAIGVKPTYALVKTYKPAAKDAFYNTHLKAAYDSANADAKAKFDQQWSLFGTQVAVGNDSAYKAAYKATFTVSEGEDKVTVTVPGNASSAQSRNILVVVKPVTEEEPDLSQDAEVLSVIAKIDAIGTVTLESETAILEAREAYNALTDEKKAYITNIAVLEAAEEELEELKAAPVPMEGFHPVVGARYVSDFKDDSGVASGKMSVAKVTSAGNAAYNGILYSGFRGLKNGEVSEPWGARWVTESWTTPTTKQHHEVYYADENLVGYDYFVSTTGDKSYASSPILEFELAESAEVVILGIRSDLAIDGFTKEENASSWAKARYFNSYYANAIRLLGEEPTWDKAVNYSDATKATFIENYYAAEYAALDADKKAAFDTAWALVSGGAGSSFKYNYAYSKTYIVPEGETVTVTIPGDTSGKNHRTPIIIVKPVDEEVEEPEEPDLSQDAEVLSVIAKIDAIGTVTLESETAILEARAAYAALSDEKKAYVTNLATLEEAEATLEQLKAEAEQPVPVEGDHIIVGARMEGEIVADKDVTNGFKSAAKVTSEKSSRTDGFVYTNLRGTPDEAGTTYGARLTSMPANSTSYHEVYYADESIAGSDYFVFTAGGNAHSDATLLKFDVVADAEVSILATSNAMAFDGFALKENNAGWIKGRFINRNMADAMNAIGVKPVYSVVKTYKTASKEDFYNTYLKAAYDSANETQKAKFDEQWNLFGTESAIGNDSAYKAMYTKTFRLPEGEDTMTITVPGNTTGASSRNILVVVRSASEEVEEPDLTEDPEVVAVVAKIDAIGTVTLDSESAIQEARLAYEALSDEKKAVVANLSVLEAAEATLEALKEAAVPVETVGDLTSKVSGLTYANYLDYIESVTGTKPVSTSVIKETDVIATSTIIIRDAFTIGGQFGSESARRRVETINEDYSFLEGVKFFSPTIEWSQQADSRKWFTKLFWGQDATYTYNGFDYTVNAKTDALPTVPWWTVPVTDATVYIASHVEMPHLEDAGWTKADTTAPVFTWKDTNNNAISNGPNIVYVKEISETTTVELPNSNTGEHGAYPYFMFFVPNN